MDDIKQTENNEVYENHIDNDQFQIENQIDTMQDEDQRTITRDEQLQDKPLLDEQLHDDMQLVEIMSDSKAVVKGEQNQLAKQKQVKLFPVEKLPAYLRKERNLKKIEKDIFKRVRIAHDKDFIHSLYQEKDGVFFIPEDRQFTKKELVRLKKISKDLRNQSKFRINVIPLMIAISAVFAVISVVIIFKDPVIKKVVQNGAESVFHAKCDVRYAKIDLLDGHIRIEGLAQANKNSPMKNLFEVDVIDLDFNITELLKKKFVSQNIQITGIKVGTDRAKSGLLPNRSGDSSFASSILALPIIQDEKNALIETLSKYNPENILANLNESLKSPDLATHIQEDVTKYYEKYEALPAQYEKEIQTLQTSYEAVRAINIEALKKKPTEIPQAINLVQGTMDKTQAVRTMIEKASADLQADAKTVSNYTKEINNAFNDDLNFISTQVNAITSFKIGDAKNLITNELKKIAVRSIDTYYPQAAVAMEKAKQFSGGQKKPVKEKKEIERKGRLVTYKKDTYPTVLLENIHLSSLLSAWNIDAKVKNISSDMDLWGKPATGEFTLDSSQIKNFGNFVLDLREQSKNLLTINYAGSGFKTDLAKMSQSLIDGASSQNINIAGLPKISGTSFIKAQLTANDFDVFDIKGNFSLDSCVITADYFEPKIISTLYSKALASLKNLNANFTIQNRKDTGFDMGIVSDIDTQFASIFTKLMNDEISTIKANAIKDAQVYLKQNLTPVYNAIGEFNSVDDIVNNQKKKIEGYQKEGEKKLADLKALANARVETEKQKATDAVKDTLKDGLKGLF